MRLLHIVPTYLPATRYGGPIFAVHGLCAALAARGHAVEVFTTSVNGPADSDVPHDVPVMLDGVKIRYFRSQVLRRLSWAPALSTALRREIVGADVVHLHSVFLWPTAAAARLARNAAVPYIVSPRGMLVQDLIGRRSSAVKRLWISLIERRNLEGAAAVHVTSSAEARDLSAFGFRLQKIAAIPNGVPDIASRPSRTPAADIAGLAHMRPLLLCFGRLSWKKGLDGLLTAFARTGTGNLAIVGTDDEGLAPRLRQMAADLGIAERVHIVPRTVTGEEREFVFAQATGLVLASLSENFGNVVIEAMQRSLAVIVTDRVGASEVVLAAGGGLVVADDPAQLAEAMALLLGDAALAAQYGKAGEAYVSAHYRWSTVAAEMEALYRSLARTPGSLASSAENHA